MARRDIWSKEAAIDLKLSRQTICNIRRRDKSINEEVARRLKKYFGEDAVYEVERIKLQPISKAAFIRSEMTRRKLSWVEVEVALGICKAELCRLRRMDCPVRPSTAKKLREYFGDLAIQLSAIS